MRQFFKRLLLPIAVAAVTQTSIVSAESIRLIGPGGEVQSAPQFSSDIVRNSSTATNSEPSPVIGPTTDKDTLWSIATLLRPSTKVTVQQTLLAIYRLNPQAFENQNIHSLIPGSVLRVPSLAQVSSASTQEAVNIMAAHKARLENKPPVVENKPTVVEIKQSGTVAKNAVESKPASDVSEPKADSIPQAVPEEKTVNNTVSETAKASPAAENEIQALEEKNHRLRLMLAQVQSEVNGLKQELGDENRIRSEVEKLLAEEKEKREEMQRLAPTKMDELLSNNWVVAGLALIPGLIIALLVMLILGRRSSSEKSSPESTQTNTASVMDAAVPPITVGDHRLDELDEELLLDDDLFGGIDDSESLFGKPGNNESESTDNNDGNIFADIDSRDLDFDLEGDDGEDLFATIDDSGGLDTDFGDLSSGNSGISIGRQDKALGLEEMEWALDQASLEVGEDVGFDLSDEGGMSQADIESLLAADGEDDEFESASLDQSMLDELFAEQEDDDSLESIGFGSLLDDNEENGRDEEVPTRFTSDADLDDLFASIEAHSDLEQLEANSYDETALLDEMLDDEPELSINSTELLDEFISKSSLDEDSDLATSDEDVLSELLGDTEKQDVQEIGEDSTDLLDGFLDDLAKESTGFDSSLDEIEDSDSKDEGLELFDELLDIERNASNDEQHFNSANFADELINNSPEKDPLLDEVEVESRESDSNEEAEPDDFEFNPEVEGTQRSAAAKSDVVANEFGIPQDDDWQFDDEDELNEHGSQNGAIDETDETESEADDSSVKEDAITEFEDIDFPEYTEEDALADAEFEPELEEESAEESDNEDFDKLLAELQEPESDEPDLEESEFEDIDLPEYTEEDALADAEDELEAEPEPSEVLFSENKTEGNLCEIAKSEFDEEALSDWLSEDAQEESGFSFDKPLDARSIDSAGMDIDAMLEVGGEDWNGFNLTPDQKATISDDVPDTERDVWRSEIQVKEPEVAAENWAQQEEFEDIDPAESQYMSIEDLMAQAEQEEGRSLNLDNEELKLDVGLNEFPDVIGDISDIDVDNNSEAAGKLDLAKIYFEMSDEKGAVKLLEEAIVDGSDEIRQQAKRLIDVINGRV